MTEPTHAQLVAFAAEVRRVREMGGHITQAEIDTALDLLAPLPVEPEPTDPPTDPPPDAPTPAPGDWPGPHNTGCPDDAELTDSGSITVTEDGAVVENVRIRGTLTIRARDVQVRNVIVDNDGRYPVHIERGASAVIEDITIRGNTSRDPGNASVAVYFKGSGTLRRADIYDVIDGPRIEADDVTIEDSWVHDLTRVEGGHHDALQQRDGLRTVIRHNTLDAAVRRPDGSVDPMNAAYQMGSPLSRDRQVSVVLEDNYLNGGTYTMRGGSADFPWVTDSVARGNVFGPDAAHGAVQGLADGWTWDASNVWAETGRPVR